tara:strand:- start:2341 stop:3762 length:1422 start_codon:yes stop_codon:yes gene_type:complete
MKHCIEYYKWDKDDSKILFNSLRNVLDIKEPQLYFPIMSLFFYIHNTPNSHRVLDFKRYYFIKEILEYRQPKEYNSNILLRSKTFNKYENKEEVIQLFGKVIPLLDPIHYLLNNYNISTHRNPLLPSNYSFNTYSKINDINNMAYIDIFLSYLVSEITIKNENPSFPIYYGSVNGINDYKYDISDDFEDLKNHSGFKKIFKNISIESLNDYSDSSDDSCSETTYSSDMDDYIVTIKRLPVAYLFIEQLEGTLEDIIKYELSLPLLRSCLFQVTFALLYLQKSLHFTHNDLHINNIMYTSTDKPYLYYKFNNQYFKVPTYGKLFKIIDFGRSVFTFRKKTYMNDVFSKYGEAEGQYTHPPQVSFLKTDYKDMVYPSYHFDLCRLAITMLDEIRYNHDDELEDSDEYQYFLDFLKYLVTDKNGNRLDKEEDNFDLYVNISKNAQNSLPRDIIVNKFFHEYRVKKKKFPKSTYYSV